MANSQEHYPSHLPTSLRVPEVNDTCMPIIKCPPDPSLQAIVFGDANLQVIKGYETKSKIELNEFFVPCHSYNELEVLIPNLTDSYQYEGELYHQADLDYVTLDYGLFKNQEGAISFIMLFPMYHLTTLDDQSKWVLKFRFQGETEWRDLGRIFMWSATYENGVLPLEIKNLTGVDIYTKIIFAN